MRPLVLLLVLPAGRMALRSTLRAFAVVLAGLAVSWLLRRALRLCFPLFLAGGLAGHWFWDFTGVLIVRVLSFGLAAGGASLPASASLLA